MFHRCTDLANATTALFLGPINGFSIVVINVFHAVNENLEPIAIDGLVFESVVGFEKLVTCHLCALHVDAREIAVC